MTTPAAESKSRPTTETVLKTLTALFGLVVAVLGFWTTQLSKEKQQAESRTVVVQQESAELRDQVAALREELDRLKRERSASPPTSGSAGSDGAASGRRVVLQAGETLDVDNRKKYRVESSGVEVSRVTDSDYLMNPRGYEFFPLTTDLNEANCKGAVGNDVDSRNSFHFDELTTGMTFCLPTSQERLAGIKVAKLPLVSEGPIELEVVLW